MTFNADTPEVRSPQRSGTGAAMVLVFVLLLLAACTAGTHENGSRLASTVEVFDGHAEITLSHSLNAAARGEVASKPLEVRRLLRGETLELGALADGRMGSHGEIFLLDRMAKQVLVLDSVGRVTARLGRGGRGPGEFTDPVAIAPIPDGVVVWQAAGAATFTYLTYAGEVIRVVPQPIAGDWRNAFFRSPVLYTHGYQQGPEDVTRRLRADGRGGFFHLISPNEHERERGGEPFDLQDPPAYLVRYDQRLEVVDTVAVLRAPALHPGKTMPGALPDYWQLLYAGRPLYAVAGNWLALAHGDSASIVVTNGGQRVRVRWPDDRRPVSTADQDTLVDWTLKAGLRNDFDFAREWSRSGRSVREAAKKEQREVWMRFAERSPNLTALFGAGECLVVVGHKAADSVDGVARTLVVIHLQRGVLGVVRLNDRGEWIHDLSTDRVLTSHRDEHGEWWIRVYDNPFKQDCEPT